MVRTAGFLLLFLLAGPAAVLQAQAVLDTTLVLPDVTVTATRAAVTTAAAPVRVTVLDAEAIAGTGAQQVAGLLEARAGLFIKRYGSGGLASLSLRGTGAAQTAILLDGHRIGDPQLGELDLSLLPTLLLSSVEVMHGAASPLYGTDGIGGAVNLRTLEPAAGLQARLMGGVGAYGERTGGLLLAGGHGALSGLVLADYEAADGDFPYHSTAVFPPRSGRRSGADRMRRSAYAALRVRGVRHRLRLSGWYNDAERGLPGLATTPPKGERQWDEHVRLWFDDEVRFGWGQLRLGGLLQRSALRYVNPSLDLDDTGRTLVSALEAEATLLAGARWLLAAGAAGGYSKADHPRLADRAAEGHAGAFLYGTGSYGAWLLYPALRADAYFLPDAAARLALSPRLGVNVQPFSGRAFHLKAHLGRAFRTPTFNQRFWQPGGNPDLRPERGWTWDAGFFLQHRQRRAEVSFFASHVRDQIVWEQTEAGYYAPVNVGRTRTVGVDVSYRQQWRWRGCRLDGGVNYTRQDARDRSEPGSRSYNRPLRYVPGEQLKLNLGLGLGPLAFDLNGRYVGRRYITSDASEALDPHFVLDAQVRLTGRRHGLEAQLALGMENLLDADYAVLQHYPMPPRHARVRLLLQTIPRPASQP